MRVTFSYCNLACYVYENMSIYMYNQVNRSQFPNSDQLQSCSNNNFNYTPSTRVASFDEVITKGKKLWSFSNSINYCFKELWDQFGETAYGYWGLKGYTFTEQTPVLHALSFFPPTNQLLQSIREVMFF